MLDQRGEGWEQLSGVIGVLVVGDFSFGAFWTFCLLYCLVMKAGERQYFFRWTAQLALGLSQLKLDYMGANTKQDLEKQIWKRY